MARRGSAGKREQGQDEQNNVVREDEDTEAVESDQRSAATLRSLSKIPRELSEEELATPGAQRMLLGLLDRLGSEVEILDRYRDRFHNCDKEKSVLSVRLNQSNSKDIVLGAALATGSLFIGLAPSIWTSGPVGPIVVVGGAILIVGSIVARLIWR